MKPMRARGAALVTVAALVSTMLPTEVSAQRRAVRAPVVVVGAYYRPLYYAPFFYAPWYSGYGWPGYGWYPYAPYGYQRGYEDASMRLQVTPRQTEVFVDGYYAGRADDFDGMFQRLHVEPGEHEIQLYLAGHRTSTQKVYLQPGGTFNIRLTMEPLGAGEPEPARPAPAQTSAPRPGIRPDPRVPPDRTPRLPPGERSAFGAIAFQVQPADAELLIDGERWRGPAVDEVLVVQVAPGRHRVEVRKDGYEPFTSEIEVVAGQTAPLNVSLPRQ